MTRFDASKEAFARRKFCLTELSVLAMVAGACGFSSVLWLLVVAVL